MLHEFQHDSDASTAVPRVSVVMAVGQDLRFLDEAVDSILRQDFHDFEFVIVDDGTAIVSEKLCKRDDRIRVIVNPANLGLAASLNRGIAEAKGNIVVRFDADDIAEPHRLRMLVAALDADRDLGIVGSWFTNIDEAGTPIGMIRVPESDLEIRWTILFYIPFCHPSVAFRRECFEAAGGYRENLRLSEDHYLFAAMLEVTRGGNIAEALIRYRSNPRGMSATAPPNWRARTHQIREKLWARLGIRYDLYDDERAGDISQFVYGNIITRIKGRMAAYRTILTLLSRFLRQAAMTRTEDRQAAQRLVKSTIERIFTDLPQGFENRVAIGWLAWRFDPRSTAIALMQLVVSSKLIREVTRPFTRSRRLRREVRALRAEVASIRSELDAVARAHALFESRIQAELLAEAQRPENQRKQLAEAWRDQPPPVKRSD